VKKYNETILTITLVNGTKIELKGADNPDSLRGVGIHYLVMDEVQDIDPEAWKKVLRPTLASTGGHALFIGTPKAYNFLHELFTIGQDAKKTAWASWQFPTITSPFIPPEEIEAARADMDEKSFRQEFEASFETMSGRVYYPFDRKVHVKPLDFNKDLPIWVGQDFNIDPMSGVILQRSAMASCGPSTRSCCRPRTPGGLARAGAPLLAPQGRRSRSIPTRPAPTAATSAASPTWTSSATPASRSRSSAASTRPWPIA
jgi:hypothetical protein